LPPFYRGEEVSADVMIRIILLDTSLNSIYLMFSKQLWFIV